MYYYHGWKLRFFLASFIAKYDNILEEEDILLAKISEYLLTGKREVVWSDSNVITLKLRQQVLAAGLKERRYCDAMQ